MSMVFSSAMWKVIGNTVVQSVGKFFSVGLSFLTIILLTRYLGVSGYGNFTLVFSYATFWGVLSDLGLQIAVIREFSNKAINQKELLGTFFWLKTILLIISGLVGLIPVLFSPYSNVVKTGIVIGLIGVSISGLTSYGLTIFQAEMKLYLVTFIDILTKIITSILMIVFILLKLNFYMLLLTVIIGNLFGLLASFILLFPTIGFKFSFEKNLARKIITWSLPVGLTTFLSLVYFKVDTIMLSLYRGAQDVGFYSLAYKILENILIFWGYYMASLYPLLSKYYNESENEKIKKLFKTSSLTAILSGLFIIVITFISTPTIISIFGGSNFSGSIIALRIIIFSIPLLFINNINYYKLIIENHRWHLLGALTGALIVNVILNYLFIPKGGYIAASYITVITELLLFVYYMIILLRSKMPNKHEQYI